MPFTTPNQWLLLCYSDITWLFHNYYAQLLFKFAQLQPQRKKKLFGGNSWEMGNNDNLPLFVTKSAKGSILFRFYTLLILIGICFIFLYRLIHIPAKEEAGRWAWMGLFLSELWFCIFWFLTMVVRWNPIYRYTFKDRLSLRYEYDLSCIYIYITC